MTTRKHADTKYVVLMVMCFVGLITGIAIVDRELIDIIYFICLIVCIIRYLLACRDN